MSIAREKKLYLEVLKEEFVNKYKSKQALKHLIDDRINGLWTNYASLKRQMTKRKNL